MADKITAESLRGTNEIELCKNGRYLGMLHVQSAASLFGDEVVRQILASGSPVEVKVTMEAMR